VLTVRPGVPADVDLRLPAGAHQGRVGADLTPTRSAMRRTEAEAPPPEGTSAMQPVGSPSVPEAPGAPEAETSQPAPSPGGSAIPAPGSAGSTASPTPPPPSAESPSAMVGTGSQALPPPAPPAP
jgi:hypothetical protein